MLLTSSRPLLQSAGGGRGLQPAEMAAPNGRVFCRASTRKPVIQSFSVLLCMSFPLSLSPFVSLDFPSPQAPQLMPASPDATTGNLSWRPSESRPLMRPPPPPVNTTFAARGRNFQSSTFSVWRPPSPLSPTSSCISCSTPLSLSPSLALELFTLMPPFPFSLRN